MPIILSETAKKTKKWCLEKRSQEIPAPGSLDAGVWLSPDHLRLVETAITKSGAADSADNFYWLSRRAGSHGAPVALSATRLEAGWGIVLYSLHGCHVAIVAEKDIRAGFFARLFGRRLSAAKAAKAAHAVLERQVLARGGTVLFTPRNCSFKKLAPTRLVTSTLASARRQEYALSHCNKVGVLYQAFGQARETEFYCNASHSPLFEYFLSWLGERIQLKGYKGYRGGLDVRRDLTGPESIVAKFRVVPDSRPDRAIVQDRPRGTATEVDEAEAVFKSPDGAVGADCELMFHVSTMMPTSRTDEQQVEKKRHIGNDNVVIIFSETINDMIDDATITSNMLMTVINVWPVSAPADTPLSERRFAFQALSRRGIPTVGAPFNGSSSGIRLTPEAHQAFMEKILGFTEGVWEEPTLKMSLTKMREASLNALAK